MPIITITTPVSIHKCAELRITAELETPTAGALEILQDVFCCFPVGRAGILAEYGCSNEACMGDGLMGKGGRP